MLDKCVHLRGVRMASAADSSHIFMASKHVNYFNESCNSVTISQLTLIRTADDT
jgi:hypothetical protein